ncbi:TonB-dependent siderophore receptor [Carnimonas bestiolae]|uniref:TonB-dependent siderophore receptor n=1 Tax=Carnimonas bestiolae TaxID=3402172 RepID=UPI003EDBBABF
MTIVFRPSRVGSQRSRAYFIPPLMLGLAFTSLAAQAQSSADDADDGERLNTVVVQGQAPTGDGPLDGYSAVNSNAATKTATPLINTARTVNVVGRQQMEDQGATNVNDALLYTPGVFTQLAGAAKRSDTISLRGFHGGDVDNTYLDGMRLQSDPATYSAMQIDSFFLERIDVVKGPSSSLYGRSMPGGIVNFTTKKPQQQQQGLFRIFAGSHGNRGAGVDVTGALPDSSLGEYRLTAIADQTDTQYDAVESKRYAIMPQVNFHLGDDTELLLSAIFQKDPSAGYHGSVPYDVAHHVKASWSDADRDNNDFERIERIFSYNLTHRFNDQLKFNSRARYTDMDVTMSQIAQTGIESENPLRLGMTYYGSRENLHAFSTDNNLQWNFDTGPIEHEVLFGADFQRMKNSLRFAGASVGSIDPYHFSHNIGRTSPITWAPHQTDRIQQGGVYLQDQMTWDKVHLSLGGREDWLDRKYHQDGVGTDSRNDHKFSANASLLYAFDNGISPYYSYSQATDPSPDTQIDGAVPPPTDSEQHEVGVKYQPNGTDDLYQIAAYNLVQKNVQQRTGVNHIAYSSVGDIRSRGIELSANTHITDKLRALASYSYNKQSYRSDSDGFQKGQTPYLSPKQMASLWLQYDFPKGVRGGIGERYVEGADFNASSSQVNSATHHKSASYALTDAFISTDLGQWTSALQGASLQLNVSNLFNRKYLSCLDSTYCYFGDQRNIMATMNYHF